ncbi:putative RNA-directed DNA polymerase [Helianthus annuus]|nr:putative RNA-directed DNA polymerase [Helianthus annuus]
MYPVKNKTKFYTVLQTFLRLVQTQLSRKIKVFQSDGGIEFTNKFVRKILDENDTFHRFSCPYTAPQNGRAERKHRHIVETGLAMLFHANVPISHWVDAFSSATYIINRLPTKILNHKSPFELLFSITPNYTNFRVFGCCVYPYLRDYVPHKLAPRSIPCIFLGYAPQYKGYKCFDPASSRMYVTRHARFDETCFPFVRDSSYTNLANLFLSTFHEPTSHSTTQHHNPTPQPPKSTHNPASPCTLCKGDSSPHPHPSCTTPENQPPSPMTVPETTHSSTTTDNTSTTNTTPTNPNPSTSAPQAEASAQSTPAPSHHMVTRSKVGTFKPNLKHTSYLANAMHSCLHAALLTNTIPKGFKSASKHPHWMVAMQDELKALHRNQTWTLVPRPSSTNIVGSKWVFRTKYHSDGSLNRHKARLVAQGFTQIPGLDFNHTFSPMVKASTIRIVLSLAVIHDWSLHQLDVNNAFLNGNLYETVYMEQPPGFVDPKTSTPCLQT